MELNVRVTAGFDVKCDWMAGMMKGQKSDPYIKSCKLFACLVILPAVLLSVDFSFRNTIRVSNCLDPDQAPPFVRPDLGPNGLRRLSADDKGRY